MSVTRIKITLVIAASFLVVGYGMVRSSATRPTPQESHEQFPIVDLSTQENTDSLTRDKTSPRVITDKGRGKKIVEEPNVYVITEAESWIERLPALPVTQSDIILSGQLLDSKAYLTDDRTKVYSAYTFDTLEVLKNTTDRPVSPGQTLTIEREGGRVRFPSGHIQTYKLSGQGAPHAGGRYVFFLKRAERSTALLILTGYELLGSSVSALDETRNHASFEKMDEVTFMGNVRKHISSPKD